MELFLEKLAGKLYGKYGENISSLRIIFPSRRAGIFFKHHLSKLIKKPLWLPPVQAIQDFIAEFSPHPVTDKLTLIFELYEIYKQFSPDESFDKFYPWGEMLLHDFDDIDKNLVEADSLFRILREIKEVEQDFDLKVADIEEFYGFWRTFSARELSEVQDNFIKTWEIIGKVYHLFRKSMQAKSICYEGMAYRRIYEMVRTKELIFRDTRLIFAGFNLLNKAEEGMISELLKQDKAETYWDADEYYLDDKVQEAGHFLRRNFVNLGIKDPEWTVNELKTGEKKIKVIGSALKVSQAKVLGNELKNVKGDALNKTAVVLPDEGMMISILHSLPDNIDSLNVTMGFPFKDSSLYNLLQSLTRLQKGKKGSGKSTVFYHKEVVQILLHPYIKFTSPYEIYQLVNTIKKRNYIYISRKKITESFSELPEIISVIFNDIETVSKSLEYIYSIITLVSKRMEKSSAFTGFEIEYLFKFYTELNHISSLIEKYSAEFDKDTFWRLLIEIAGTIRIPFIGEPLKGLQLMGLLETRLLDFENIYILSMNEDIMPRSSRHSSFIPHSLRKAFKMPTFEDDDSTSAYYFYRLLQRAKNICLIYNTEPGEIFTGEKSRFLMQVENELAAENKNIKLENLVLQTDIEIPKRKEIIISKTNRIIESLKNEKHLSATSLSTYINCPLQFYLKTVVKLRKQDEVEEFFTGWGFGTILHQIMEHIYAEYVGKNVDKRTILNLRDHVKKNFDKIWEKACASLPEYEEFKGDLTGKSLLYKNIIKKLVGKILTNDMSQSPFKIISLEEQIIKEINIQANQSEFKVKLLGRLDRVEEKDGVTRIIDYKTGIVHKGKLKVKINQDNVDTLFTDPDYREKFQQHFYSNVYLQKGNDQKLKMGIYPIREMSDGIMFFDEEYISPEVLSLYENKLRELLTRIFDLSVPFTQTPELKRCRYCDYNSICYRD